MNFGVFVFSCSYCTPSYFGSFLYSATTFSSLSCEENNLELNKLAKFEDRRWLYVVRNKVQRFLQVTLRGGRRVESTVAVAAMASALTTVAVNGLTNGKPNGKSIKSKNQLRRAKAKAKKAAKVEEVRRQDCSLCALLYY